MREYKWKGYDFSYLADANLVGRELELIEVEGELTNKDVLDYAKHNEDSELYKCFEWNDDIASERWRLHQASTVLHSITIVAKEKEEGQEEETIRAYVTIKNKDNEKVLKNISLVVQNDEEYKQLKEKAYNDFEKCREKYDSLLEREDLKKVVLKIYQNM